MAHAKGPIDRLRLAFSELTREFVKIDVVFVDERIDFAKSQELIFLRQAEHFEHRMRPKHTAAREIPIPQPAASAVERGVDAAADRVIDNVGLARPSRLPVEGKT